MLTCMDHGGQPFRFCIVCERYGTTAFSTYHTCTLGFKASWIRCTDPIDFAMHNKRRIACIREEVCTSQCNSEHKLTRLPINPTPSFLIRPKISMKLPMPYFYRTVKKETMIYKIITRSSASDPILRSHPPSMPGHYAVRIAASLPSFAPKPQRGL
jgi:hypothetical protein